MVKELFKKFNKADKSAIETALYLVKCSQNDFNSLDLNIRKLAYRFNLAITPDLDSYYLKVKKDNNDISLPTLTKEHKQLADEFINKVSDYLNTLPCFKAKLSKNEQAQIIEDLKQYINQRLGAYDYNGRVKMLNADYMTKYLINYFNVIKIKRGQTVLAYWNGETYQTGEQAISDLVTKIRSIEYNNSTSKIYRETFNLKALINSLNNAITETTPLASADYIPCLNGIIHLKNDNTYELLTFSPDIVTIYQFQGNYKPLSEIPAETINKLAHYLDLLANIERETEAHYKELKNRILEGASIVLFRDQIFKTFLFFHGSHDGGKTSFIEKVVFSLLPNGSYSKLPINRLNERFAMSELVGKLANLNDEHNFNYGRTGQAEQAQLKEIVSGGQKLRAERKSVNAFDFVCEAKMFIALNDFLNIPDKNTKAKMLYIPMRGNLSRAECTPYYPDMSNQNEKNYIFNVLLQYLLKVFNNYKSTGKYFTYSKYIDDTLMNEAEFKTSDLLNELQSWIDETNPFKEYKLGQLLSDKTKKIMLASHYYYKFRDFLNTHDSRINISQDTFRDNIQKVSNFKVLKNAKENGKSYNFILVPMSYNNTTISTYADYKQAVLLEQAQRAETANIIDINTKAEADRVKTELGQNNKRGVNL